MFVAAVAAISLAGPAAAQTPSSDDYGDARCFLAMSMFAANPPNGKPLTTAARSGMDTIKTYYFGKLKGRSPALDLASVMTPAIIQDIRANLATQVGNCISEAENMGKAVSRAEALVGVSKAP